jgi:hypothetical protein
MKKAYLSGFYETAEPVNCFLVFLSQEGFCLPFAAYLS